ncbi:ABC transporter ATP-binding protein [Microbacterium sp. KR10-403]|uniref:ABC transporter ATP-binding protein n=1 Tax=Microbacterium sp. KR10-403 TaxID=3158581 RepID=UPI0032E49D75
MPTINLERVEKNYGGGAASAVRELNLEIGDAEFMCLLGPSGCGKTTTLRMIAGLEHLTGGKIVVGERAVDAVDDGVFVPPEKRGMGLVFQSYALWPHLTIRDNVEFGLRLRKVDKKSRNERADGVMKALGIEKYKDRYPSQLSGGQQQRVALARMLAVSPDVLLLDEPLSNLDARLRLEMRAELKRLHGEFDTTIVFVTHDQWEAMTLATKIAVMSEGVLQQVGSPDEIYNRPANRFVAEFVGNSPINIVELANDAAGGLGVAAISYVSTRLGKLKDLGSIGIRPEAVHLVGEDEPAPDAAFSCPAEVTGILPTGGSWIVELTAADQKLFMITSEPPTVAIGDRARTWVKPTDLHVFDTQGTRSEQADEQLAEL